MNDKHLNMCIIVSGYRHAIKDFINRGATPEAIVELLEDVERAEANFKLNEGKEDEQ